MTLQEKAKDLVDKFTVVGLQQRNEGVQCAIIAVNEIIHSHYYDLDAQNYWQRVKKEIEKL